MARALGLSRYPWPVRLVGITFAGVSLEEGVQLPLQLACLLDEV